MVSEPQVGYICVHELEYRMKIIVNLYFFKKSIPNNAIVTSPPHPQSLQCHLPDPEWKVYPGGPTPAPKLQLLHHLPRGNQNLWSHSGTLAWSSIKGQWLVCSLAVWWGHWSYRSQNTPCVRKLGAWGRRSKPPVCYPGSVKAYFSHAGGKHSGARLEYSSVPLVT